MDKLLGSLSLGAIFRHFISGGWFIMAFLYSRYGLTAELLKRVEAHYAFLGFAAILSGALIYAVHRGTTNPFIEWLRFKKYARWCSEKTLPDPVMKFMLMRWQFTKEEKKVGDHIFEWGDYVHLLYTAAFAIWSGSLMAYFFSVGTERWRFSWAIFLGGLVCMVAGAITDFRKQKVEEEIYKNTDLYISKVAVSKDVK